MNTTRWWKCDLQIATPAWNFNLPVGNSYILDSKVGRAQFLDDYMSAIKNSGIEIVAIADHNTGEWIDEAKEAGERNGVVVFPGCEITTHTGSDGVHLLILGDLNKTSKDFDRLIHGELGFDSSHPAFNDSGNRKVPGRSAKTISQILDSLPDDYLVIAPHVFN